MFAASCGDGGPESGVPTLLEVTPDAAALVIGEEVQLSCRVSDQNGAALGARTCTYGSADTGIAKVTFDGRLRGMAVGATSVSVEYGQLEITLRVTVASNGPGNPFRIVVTPESLSINQLTTGQLTAQVQDARGNVLPITVQSFTPDDLSLLATSTSGRVVSQGRGGLTSVRVSAVGLADTIPVFIAQVPSGVRINDARIVMAPGSTRQLYATVFDLVGDAIPDSIVTFSGGGGSLTVSASGLLTAGAGTNHALVHGSSSGMTAEFRVSVLTPPSVALVSTSFLADKLWTVAMHGNEAFVASSDGPTARIGVPSLAGTALPGGGTPLGIAVDGAGQYLYVAGAEEGTLGPVGASIIDLSTNTRVGYLAHGDNGPAWSVAVCPANQAVYVGTGTGKVIVFSAVTRAWLATISTPGTINHFLCHGTRVYASASSGGSIYEIDAAAHTVLRTVGESGLQYQSMAISPDGSLLYGAAEGSFILAWDLATLTSDHVAPDDVVTTGMAMTSDGKWLYTAGWGAGRVVILDSYTLAPVETIVVGGFPRSLAISADGSYIVVVNQVGRIHLLHQAS